MSLRGGTGPAIVAIVLLGAIAIAAATSTEDQAAPQGSTQPRARMTAAQVAESLNSQSDVSIFRNSQILIKNPVDPIDPNLTNRFGAGNLDRTSYESSVFVSSLSGCTATVVGPRTVITAAHCTPGRTIVFPSAAQPVTAICHKLSELEPAGEDHDDDLALCFTDQALPGPHETLRFDAAAFEVGKELLLSGYGLTGLNGTQTVGESFNIGIVAVTRAALTSTPPEITARGRARLQPGDSGGGVFSVPEGQSHRYLVAVAREMSHGRSGESFLTPLAAPHVQALIAKWKAGVAQAQGLTMDICGMDGFEKDCR